MMAMACCVATMALGSCDSDDDNQQTITPAELAAAQAALRGNYTGMLKYSVPSDNSQLATDSATVQLTVENDTAFVVHGIPAKAFASNLADADLAQAIADQPDSDLKCLYGIYTVGNATTTFIANPTLVTYDVDYKGGHHKVQMAFFINNQYSFGQYRADTGVLGLQFVFGGAYIDEQPVTNSLKNGNVFFQFQGKKQ